MEEEKTDIIQELDKRYRSIISTFDDAQLRMVLNCLDRLGSKSSSQQEKKKGRTPPPPPPPPKDKLEKGPKETPPPKESPPPRRDAYCYLYVQRNESLSRLNLTKLLLSGDAPIFELVCDFGPSLSYPRTCVNPLVCFNVDSDFYMLGDTHTHSTKSSPPQPQPFFQVLSIDDKSPPSFLPCPQAAGTIADGFAGPVVYPLVVTLHGRIYVMSLLPYVGDPCFQVFDNGRWKTLPPPPFLPDVLVDRGHRPFYSALSVYSTHYAWGHKIVVCFSEVYYCFDTKTAEWIDLNPIYEEFGEDVPVLSCVAEYNNNFLIAKLFFSQELAVYELDQDGYPHFYHKLEEMFVSSHIPSYSLETFIIPFDDDADKFCLIHSDLPPPKMGGEDDRLLQVAVFRMTISNLEDGKKKLTAVLEAYQSYLFYKLAGSSFYPVICSAFLKRDNLNLVNLEADPSFGRACLD